MFGLFKKKSWVSEDAVKYLMGISPLFTIGYVSLVGKTPVRFQFRNERGEMVANLQDRNVTEVYLVYQGNGMPCNAFLANGRLDASNLRDISSMFDKFISECPNTASDINVKDIHLMQKGLHDEIEKIVNVYGWDKGKGSRSNNIKVFLNSIKPQYRSRLMDFLVRLDKCSVPVTITIHIDGTTDEMIGSTLNELAMFELNDANKDADEEDLAF